MRASDSGSQYDCTARELTCSMCSKGFRGIPVPWDFWRDNTWALPRLALARCQGCEAWVCDQCKKRVPGWSWWSWKAPPCPSCGGLFGPGLALVNEAASGFLVKGARVIATHRERKRHAERWATIFAVAGGCVTGVASAIVLGPGLQGLVVTVVSVRVFIALGRAFGYHVAHR